MEIPKRAKLMLVLSCLEYILFHKEKVEYKLSLPLPPIFLKVNKQLFISSPCNTFLSAKYVFR